MALSLAVIISPLTLYNFDGDGMFLVFLAAVRSVFSPLMTSHISVFVIEFLLWKEHPLFIHWFFLHV